ncbi:transmembrane domain-containing protein [Cryptosporidium canis]|uniref:Transmembrane domain-containing protein n=1 Tax=Cryptosporidium canis TaxID=195482 RepID=A0ABQ8PCY5_9CRYT|nr:transmembrane domain-containing protein [Cryptosporidium canis]KAJ1614843.1 transmembrane domain-containing protein [Cryptosporidium canis]
MSLRFSTASLAFAASLFTVQAVIMYLWMYQNTLLFLMFLIGDIPLLMNFLLRRHESNSAISGGLQWFWYSLILTLKIVFLVWHKAFDNSSDSSLIDRLPYTVLPSSIIPTILFITPAIYILLSFRAAPQLYGSPIYVLSTESLLHSDLVTHVLLDLIDILVQMQHEQYPASLLIHSTWIYMYSGIVLTLVLFFHGLSFPTSGGEPTISQRQGGDVYIVRKHAALVGIFLVDIPLLILRIYIWLHFPVFPGFNPWIMKNILFIPLQIVRLNQCRLAEKERFHKSQRESFFSSIVNREEPKGDAMTKRAIPPFNSKQHQVAHSKRSDTKNSTLELSVVQNKDDFNENLNLSSDINMSASLNNNSSQFKNSVPSRNESSSMQNIPNSNFSAGNLQKTYNMSIRQRIPNSDEAVFQDNASSQFTNNLSSRNEQTKKEAESAIKRNFEHIIKDINSSRKIPAQSFSLGTILKQLIFIFQRSGQSSYLSAILDNTLNVTQFQNIRLSLALIIPLISQIALCVVCRNPDQGGMEVQCDVNWFFPTLTQEGGFYKMKCNATYISFICINFISYNLLWLGMAKYFEVICGAIYQLVILTSYFFVIHSIRNAKFIDPFLSGINVDVGNILVLLCICPAVMTLLFNYFPLSSAFLGRKHLRLATPFSKKQWIVNQVPVNTDQKNQEIEVNNIPNENKDSRDDEVGYLNIGSCLLLLNCRFGIAPISMNELLIGPDTIKGVRLIDLLLSTFYRDVLFILVTRGILLTICFTWASLGVFVSHITFMIFYGITSHTIRLLALRRFELKILFQKILRDIVKEDTVIPSLANQSSAILSSFNQLYKSEEWKTHTLHQSFFRDRQTTIQQGELLHIISQISQPYIAHNSVVKKYTSSGFFSSPGNILLPYTIGTIPL